MDPGTGVRFRLRIERNSANVITGDVPSELWMTPVFDVDQT